MAILKLLYATSYIYLKCIFWIEIMQIEVTILYIYLKVSCRRKTGLHIYDITLKNRIAKNKNIYVWHGFCKIKARLHRNWIICTFSCKSVHNTCDEKQVQLVQLWPNFSTIHFLWNFARSFDPCGIILSTTHVWSKKRCKNVCSPVSRTLFQTLSFSLRFGRAIDSSTGELISTKNAKWCVWSKIFTLIKFCTTMHVHTLPLLFRKRNRKVHCQYIKMVLRCTYKGSSESLLWSNTLVVSPGFFLPGFFRVNLSTILRSKPNLSNYDTIFQQNTFCQSSFAPCDIITRTTHAGSMKQMRMFVMVFCSMYTSSYSLFLSLVWLSCRFLNWWTNFNWKYKMVCLEQNIHLAKILHHHACSYSAVIIQKTKQKGT